MLKTLDRLTLVLSDNGPLLSLYDKNKVVRFTTSDTTNQTRLAVL